MPPYVLVSHYIPARKKLRNKITLRNHASSRPDMPLLGSKFDIPHSLIQDPAFTAAERAFLTKRGHAVIPYPSQLFGKGHSSPLDPALLPRISHKTFFFAPYLDIDIGVDVLLAAKPSLHWGHDVCLNIGSPYFVCLPPFQPLLWGFSPFRSTFSPCPLNRFVLEPRNEVSNKALIQA